MEKIKKGEKPLEPEKLEALREIYEGLCSECSKLNVELHDKQKKRDETAAEMEKYNAERFKHLLGKYITNGNDYYYVAKVKGYATGEVVVFGPHFVVDNIDGSDKFDSLYIKADERFLNWGHGCQVNNCNLMVISEEKFYEEYDRVVGQMKNVLLADIKAWREKRKSDGD